ncbi:MAG: galactokinase family protein [Eubacteriales bacterium]
MKASELKAKLKNGGYDAALITLYGGENVGAQRARYCDAADNFIAIYGDADGAGFYSVPGRSEISGNHTDHNYGRVLAASIDLDIIAVAAPADDNVIRIKSEGFPEDVVGISEIAVDEGKFFTSYAVIGGMCDGFAKRGYKIGGLCAYTTSNVFKGSGLSSSAAFEDMVGNLLNYMYNGAAIDAPTIAVIAQYAENVFFGKPCGLMDQTACAVGGFVAIDFADPASPVVEKLPFDLSGAGYALCIVNTGGNHADLNADYASVPAEMKAVAAVFGRKVLRGLAYDDIASKIPELREKLGDRAILRALHFIEENDRVKVQGDALSRGDIDAFFDGVLASGRSSYMKLQNVYTTVNVAEQGLSLALAVAEHTLSGCARRAAWRVHGGGFAGTIQAFVPVEDVERFRAAEDGAFGAGACHILRVRTVGATKLEG